MDQNGRPPPPDGPARASGSETGSERTGADGSTRQLLEQLLKEQGRIYDVVMKQQAQLSAMQPSTGGPGILDDTVHQPPVGNDWSVAARVAAHPPQVAMPRSGSRGPGGAPPGLYPHGSNSLGPVFGGAEPTDQHDMAAVGAAPFVGPVNINSREWAASPVRAQFAPIKLKGVEGLMSLEQLNDEFEHMPEK